MQSVAEFDTAGRLIKHGELLTALAESPDLKPVLAERLSVSTQTVYRKCRELSDLGLVERTDAGYELTALGRLQAHACRSIVGIMSTIEQAAPVLAHVSSGSLPPVTFFDGAEVVRPTRFAPDAPTNRCTTVFETSTELSALLPVVTERWLTVLRERALADRRTTLSIDREVIARLRTHSEAAVDDILGADATELTPVSGSVPFGVILDDGQTTLVVHDERGVLVGLVVTESDEATRWATELIGTYSTTDDDFGN